MSALLTSLSTFALSALTESSDFLASTFVTEGALLEIVTAFSITSVPLLLLITILNLSVISPFSAFVLAKLGLSTLAESSQIPSESVTLISLSLSCTDEPSEALPTTTIFTAL